MALLRYGFVLDWTDSDDQRSLASMTRAYDDGASVLREHWFKCRVQDALVEFPNLKCKVFPHDYKVVIYHVQKPVQLEDVIIEGASLHLGSDVIDELLKLKERYDLVSQPTWLTLYGKVSAIV